MSPLPDAHQRVVRLLVDRLSDDTPPWALTGSTSFALQGVPMTPNDVDVQTTENGAYAIEAEFEETVVEPVSERVSDEMRSHYGKLRLADLEVELMGDLQKRDATGAWEPPVDVTDHRTWVSFDGRDIPVLDLAYEARAYERLGRTETARLLRDHQRTETG